MFRSEGDGAWYCTVLLQFLRDADCLHMEIQRWRCLCSRSSAYKLCEHVNTLLLGVILSDETRLLYVTELIKLWLLRNAKATY